MFIEQQLNAIEELNNIYYNLDERPSDTIRHNAIAIKRDFDVDYMAVALALLLTNISEDSLEYLLKNIN